MFNFWEPTHYLNHGYGLQTWELSPEYAIRSWLYTTLHAVPIYLISWLPLLNTNKADEWFLMRAMLCSCCLFCEMRFYGALQRSISQSVATIYAIASVSSAGMFHASVSYLPSTFAMYASMLAAAAFLNPEHPDSLSKGLTFLAIGTIIGWPFVAVLAVPFVLAEIYRSLSRRDVAGLARRLVTASWTSLLVLVSSCAPQTYQSLRMLGHRSRRRQCLLPQTRLRPIQHHLVQRLQLRKRSKYLWC